MSKKLKENQIIAAKLISFGFSSRSVSKWINVREETIIASNTSTLPISDLAKSVKNQKDFRSQILKEILEYDTVLDIGKAMRDEHSKINAKKDFNERLLTKSYLLFLNNSLKATIINTIVKIILRNSVSFINEIW